MERVNYTEFGNGFDTVILEESFVLNLKTTMSFVDFQIELAINEKYPLYTPPEPRQKQEPVEDEEYELETTGDSGDEGQEAEAPEEEGPQYSYRRGRIFFPNMEQVKWQSRIQPYIDPGTGTVDYGAIDYFYKEENTYFLAGYWGELEITCGEPLLEIDELKNQPRTQPGAQNEAAGKA